jgi:hypothetical protein
VAQEIREQLRLTPDADHAARVADTLSFATDDQLAGWLRPAEQRLTTVENGIAHFKQALPGLERECAAIRQNITAVLHQLDRQAA